MEEIHIVQVETMDMLSLSILVLFLGMFLNRKIKQLPAMGLSQDPTSNLREYG